MPTGEYTNVMVAVDGSKTAELAFKKAVNIVLRNNGKLFIAHIIDTRSVQSFYPMGNTSTDSTSLLQQQRNAAQNTLNRFIEWSKDRGVTNVEIILKNGSPRTELSDVLPEENNIDLLVLGATGLSAIERAFVGSVSQYVVRNAPCDVLVVRSKNEQIDDDPIID